LGALFEFLLYNPFSWLLIQLYEITRSYVIAIILFALIAKIVLLYFSGKGKLSTLRQQRLQPKIQALQKQYKNDKQKLQAETMKLYQIENVSPMGGCLWMLLPFPVLIVLFQLVRQPLTRLMGFQGTQEEVYIFLEKLFSDRGIAIPAMSASDFNWQTEMAQIVQENFVLVQNALDYSIRNIDFTLFGTNLLLTPTLPWQTFNWLFLIPIVSAATAFLQFHVVNKVSKIPQNPQMKYMVLLGPGMSLWFGFMMPAVMSIYWTANNVFGMVQDVYLTKKYSKVLDAEDAKRAELETRRKEAEAKQKEEDRQRRAERIEQKNKNAKKYKMTKKPK
jgi:YidC/Oxa1 family membrane protein insertase